MGHPSSSPPGAQRLGKNFCAGGVQSPWYRVLGGPPPRSPGPLARILHTPALPPWHGSCMPSLASPWHAPCMLSSWHDACMRDPGLGGYVIVRAFIGSIAGRVGMVVACAPVWRAKMAWCARLACSTCRNPLHVTSIGHSDGLSDPVTPSLWPGCGVLAACFNPGMRLAMSLAPMSHRNHNPRPVSSDSHGSLVISCLSLTSGAACGPFDFTTEAINMSRVQRAAVTGAASVAAAVAVVGFALFGYLVLVGLGAL